MTSCGNGFSLDENLNILEGERVMRKALHCDNTVVK